MTTRKPDVEYAGKVIADWIEPRYGSPYGLVKVAPGAPASTTYKVIKGNYDPSHKVVRKLEVALGWPVGTTARLAVKDFKGMTEIGAPTELVRLAQEIADDAVKRIIMGADSAAAPARKAPARGARSA